MRSRNWGANTLWEINPDLLKYWITITGTLIGGPNYFCFQQEIAPTTGNHHWQMFCQYPTNVGAKRVFLNFNVPTMHLEKCRCPKKAQEYCSPKKKENGDPTPIPGTFFEWGVFKEDMQGSRLDIAELKEMGEEGCTEIEMFKAHYSTMLSPVAKGVMRYRYLCGQELEKPLPIVVWIHGGTGVGKSRLADREHNLYRVSKGTYNNVWYDNYDPFIHKAVVFEEYRAWHKLSELLPLLDRYKMDVQIKGGSVNFVPERIYITSPMSPRELFKGCGEQILQLERRCLYIIHMDKELITISKLIKDDPDFKREVTTQATAKGFPVLPELIISHKRNAKSRDDDEAEPRSYKRKKLTD